MEMHDEGKVLINRERKPALDQLLTAFTAASRETRSDGGSSYVPGVCMLVSRFLTSTAEHLSTWIDHEKR